MTTPLRALALVAGAMLATTYSLLPKRPRKAKTRRRSIVPASAIS
jgi:hypothetical protein